MNRPEPLLDVRAVLADAWRLFQVSWLGCLPLALLAGAASTAPSREGIRLGERAGFQHSSEWWGVSVASAVLTLVCLTALMLRQLALAQGDRRNPWEAMHLGLRRLPQSMGTLVLMTAPLALSVVALQSRPRWLLLALCVVLPWLAWMSFAWPASLAEGLLPLAALRRGAELVRGRLLRVFAFVGAVYAVVIVYVILATIFINLALSIAGIPQPTGPGQQTLSSMLLMIVGALLVVWVAAAWNAAYARLRITSPARPASAAPSSR